MTKKITPDTSFEDCLLSSYSSVVGIDEVGRGPWAGPVTVCAFVYNFKTTAVNGVMDSKELTHKKRSQLSTSLIREKHSIVSYSNKKIDEIGITKAVALAMSQAVLSLKLSNFFVLIDGFFKFEFPFPCKMIIKGDSKHYSIASASIIAKEHRDSLMGKYSQIYPGYGFEKNAGYGTKEHKKAIDSIGICEIHRRSFRPISEIIKNV